jgi:hypothetical protein
MTGARGNAKPPPRKWPVRANRPTPPQGARAAATTGPAAPPVCADPVWEFGTDAEATPLDLWALDTAFADLLLTMPTAQDRGQAPPAAPPAQGPGRGQRAQGEGEVKTAGGP